jgi:inner membrane protein
MDSITQAALGAALGETILARRLGNKAILWGAAIGTLPDLDVLAFPWLDAVERLQWHRGLSHSFAILLGLTPLLTWLMRRIHRADLRDCRGHVAWFVFANLVTHVLIDCFNVYGTQVLEPFAPHRVWFGNMFIIDPLFTLPLLLPLLLVLRSRPGSRWRTWLPRAGMLAAALYVSASFLLQQQANDRFAAAIEAQGIPARQWHSSAAPLTTLYWRCLVDAGDEFWVTFVSVLDPPDRPLLWNRIPRNEHLLGGHADSRAVEAIEWFSEGYWAAERNAAGELVLHDLRFGDTDAGRQVEHPRSWAFQFVVSSDGQTVRRESGTIHDLRGTLAHVWRRALGRTD